MLIGKFAICELNLVPIEPQECAAPEYIVCANGLMGPRALQNNGEYSEENFDKIPPPESLFVMVPNG